MGRRNWETGQDIIALIEAQGDGGWNHGGDSGND